MCVVWGAEDILVWGSVSRWPAALQLGAGKQLGRLWQQSRPTLVEKAASCAVL